MTFWAGYDKKRIGKGNPYYCCKGCGLSDPDINGDIKRHGPGCPEVVKYLAELHPTETDPVLVEGTVFSNGYTYEYMILAEFGYAMIHIVLRAPYGTFYPMGAELDPVEFNNLMIASETFRDAVGLKAAQAILQDAEIPRSHMMWYLGLGE